jgi:phosphoserine phosphatase
MQPAIRNPQSPSEDGGVATTGLVASDLEGTLTTGETWRGVGRYLCAERGPWTAARYRAFFAANTPGALLARRGVIDEQAMRLRWMRDLARFFRGFDTADLGRMAEWVVEHELWPKRREAVIAELATHRAAGQRVILVSGTYQPVLEIFARRIDAEAIGTPLELHDGHATGRLAGPVNNDGVKVTSLRPLLGDTPLVAAYGDTPSDVPMLELSAVPTVVGNNARLCAVAAERGWRLLRAG